MKEETQFEQCLFIKALCQNYPPKESLEPSEIGISEIPYAIDEITGEKNKGLTRKIF